MKQTAYDLAEALKVLGPDGETWGQKAMYCGGAYCSMGAIRAAVMEVTEEAIYEEASEAQQERIANAQGALYDVLVEATFAAKADSPYDTHGIAAFNDREGRQFGDIQRLFIAAIAAQ